jgi:uncharacterized protein (TIGR01370 family)
MAPRDRLRLTLLAGLLFRPGWGISRSRVSQEALTPHTRFVVYYGTVESPALYGNDIAVLDSDIDRAVLARFAPRTLLLGYLSVGEVHKGRSYAAEIDRQGMLLSPNPAWPDARFIDVRDPRWKQRIVDELVPAMLRRGFRGLFIDTLDSVAFLEQADPAGFGGMMLAAADIVSAIRRAFPDMPIMVNRGYALLPRIASEIDMLMGESVHTTFDATSESYVRVSADALRWQLDRLNEARRRRPSLKLFSLDYWDPADTAGLAQIYTEARANGLIPYVATIDLSRVVVRP